MKKGSMVISSTSVYTSGVMLGKGNAQALSKLSLDVNACDETHVVFSGYDENGKIIKGGMSITVDSMDKLAKDWLARKRIKFPFSVCDPH